MKSTIANGLILLITITATFAAGNAKAQSSYGHQHQHHGHHGHGGDFGGGYGFGFGYGPATAAESFLRGQADLVRAWGQNNYYNSMAQVHWEQAREKSIANHAAKVEQFFALRKFNEEQRLGAIAKSRLSKEKLVALSKQAAPKRLGEEHWNAATDGLAWPAALQHGEFASARVRLDGLFRLRRDTSSSLAGDDLAEAQRLTDTMTEGLKSMVSKLKPADYAAAKRFLTSIAHEATFDLLSGERLVQN